MKLYAILLALLAPVLCLGQQYSYPSPAPIASNSVSCNKSTLLAPPTGCTTVPGFAMQPEVNGRIAGIFSTFTASPLPTITYNSSAMTGAQAFLSNASGVPSSHFSFYGVGFSQRSTVFPQYNVLQSMQTSETLGSTEFQTSFYVQIASQMDIIKYGDAQYFALWIDNQYVGRFAPPITTGTAQAGTTTSITLASGASATTNFYVGFTVSYTGGTGSGELCLVSAYNGSTKVATCSNTLATASDATTTYAVVDDIHGYQVATADGSVHYVNLNWGAPGIHKIDVLGEGFYGVDVGPTDTVWAAPPTGATRELVIGDSFIEGSGGPFSYNPSMADMFGRLTGWQIWPDGEGSTGWVAIYSTGGNQRFNFMDRCAPPPEAWQFQTGGSTAGTYTISVTYGGSTQTTGNIAYNASDTTVQTAIQGLSNVPASSVVVAGGGAYGRGWLIIIHGASGATMNYNGSGLTGGSPSIGNWPGVISPRVPLDGAGNALPFIIYIQGSGNDNAGGYSAAQIQSNATTCAQAISAKYPSAMAVFSGVVAVQTHGGNGLVDATDVGYNSAIKAASGYLSKINGNTPFIDTYPGGAGSNAKIFGAGNIGSPTSSKNDILISLTTTGHPTGMGDAFLDNFVVQQQKSLFGAY